MDFRQFGLFDGSTPADAALDAMVQDPSVHRVEARTDLNFTKRHTFSRSRIELDFGGNRVTTRGIEKNTDDNPFGAVLYFRGTVGTTTVRSTLSAPMPDLADVFEVPDSKTFAVGQWWSVEIDAAAGTGLYEKEVQKLVQVTEIVDEGRIRVNYKIGWDLAAGRTFTWKHVEPVERAHVRDMVFEGVADVPDGDTLTGSHPVAYEYAVSCDVSGIDATGTFWPVVMRRWCTYFRTSECRLKNPASVTWGGAGYLTQQIYCLYGHVEDCHVANSRHLNDWTASAYGYVTNCHGDGDDQGPFVTHGQFEHDLTYTGNSGLMTFANSGTAWGGAAKRITVRKHACSWFVARTNVTDLTLEDMLVIGNSQAGSGMIWVNADGAQLRGCVASGPLVVSQSSRRSKRPTVIADSAFVQGKASEVTAATVTADVHLLRVTLNGLDGAQFNGAGRLVLDHCAFTGASASAGPGTVAHTETTVHGGSYTDTGLLLKSAKDQRLWIDGGAVFSGTNSAAAFLSGSAGDRTVSWQLDGLDSRTADPGTAHVLITGGVNRYRAGGSVFTGGRLDLAPAAFAGAGHLLHTGCTEDGVTRTRMPAEGARIQHTAGNLIL
ncbi:peptidase C14 [Streptomyces sp. NBC_01477]|uniref:peptidase C14 n=1 Tax=Streptomyces sp. NBC_01477 TaxID=2976015 RepID=UPI002E325712|nr:peptidase C14 [Streptomyces sp. NBC_01477]